MFCFVFALIAFLFHGGQGDIDCGSREHDFNLNSHTLSTQYSHPGRCAKFHLPRMTLVIFRRSLIHSNFMLGSFIALKFVQKIIEGNKTLSVSLFLTTTHVKEKNYTAIACIDLLLRRCNLPVGRLDDRSRICF